ncbi:hypothetical protein ABZX51_001017 [Aspergillus tubingensis]
MNGWNGLDDDRRQILSLVFGWFASASHYRSVNLRTPGSCISPSPLLSFPLCLTGVVRWLLNLREACGVSTLKLAVHIVHDFVINDYSTCWTCYGLTSRWITQCMA